MRSPRIDRLQTSSRPCWAGASPVFLTVTSSSKASPRWMRPSPFPLPSSATWYRYAKRGRASPLTKMRASMGDGTKPLSSRNSTRTGSSESGSSRLSRTGCAIVLESSASIFPKKNSRLSSAVSGLEVRAEKR